jgi:hypothetical protein
MGITLAQLGEEQHITGHDQAQKSDTTQFLAAFQPEEQPPREQAAAIRYLPGNKGVRHTQDSDLAPPTRIERVTPLLGGVCSIH